MDTKKAQKIIEEIFNLLGLPVESVSYSLDDKRGHVFSVKSAEFEKVSLGKEEMVKDLVYLLKRLFNKGIIGEESFKCTVDINDLQSKTDDKIKVKALRAAEEARKLKTDILLDPMSSYERMVVHSTLSGSVDIITESVGEGRERRIKIKYLSI
ncbi:MAG: R3H domain-containing nucleic acid-binding protein [bacterium]